MERNLPDPEELTTFAGCFVRLTWSLLGPIGAVFLAMLLALHRPAVGHLGDFLYLGLVVAAIATRCLDRTSEPDRRRYSFVVAAAGAVLWVGVRTVPVWLAR